MIDVRAQYDRIRSDRFLLAWNLATLSVLLAPLIIFAIARAGADGEEQQQQDQADYYDEYGNYVGPSHWWQFWKKNNYNNNYNQDQGQNDQEEGGAPWWYLWTDERREEEEGYGTLVFVYLWTVISLVLLGVFGNRLVNDGNFQSLRWMLFSFMNYAFIVMVLIGGLDAVNNEGRQIEETGWYGQTSVLLFLTCLFGMFKCVIFQFWLGRRAAESKEDSRTEELIEGGAQV